MKVIDLLNKIAKGEEVPKKIRIDHWCYEFEWAEHLDNYYDKSADIDLMSALSMSEEEFNYGVKIIKEEQDIKELDLKQVEHGTGNYYLLNEYGTKCCLTKHSKIIADKVNELIKAVNQLKKEKNSER